jgi:hypothetical protein
MANHTMICISDKQKYFFEGGLTGFDPTGKSVEPSAFRRGENAPLSANTGATAGTTLSVLVRHPLPH